MQVVSEMTYNVSMGTLNPTIPYHTPMQEIWAFHGKCLKISRNAVLMIVVVVVQL